ncbi:DNA polymerase epsilon subunit D [Debaryomyces fabryi]|uniref:DNA polymerase epsilon subunit D n=1 Tax=Debaryomyces fabryi TaxID=58627 RepID=A0A0V1Q084_9ASCO|nr:DNA polymerase epsilon subunit D [Debaryomyces fabryi]KSA01583.1 DNA polymerase epsilon subunit D [Debaryomyces fabryi]CUM49860.1 unnamed protein product [Debaryomyces fabryi]
MPPKGWRKNTEGQYPQPNKDQDLVSIDDILFPRATVQKLAKNIMNASSDEGGSNMILAKDSMTALQRSSTVFVSHLLFQARQISKDEGRKTVNAQDILGALEKAEFSGFIPEVKQKLSVYESNAALRKKHKAEKKVSKPEGVDASPLSKRLKDNDEQTIQRDNNVEIEDDHEADDDDEDVTEELANDEETNNKESKEDGEEELDDDKDNGEVEENPIALLSREEDELRGEEAADVEDVQNSSEDDS